MATVNVGMANIRRQYAGIDDIPGPAVALRWELLTYARYFRRAFRAARAPQLPARYARSLRAATRDRSRDLAQPVFIVGSPRSGTTFLGSCFGEVDSFAYFFEPPATMMSNGLVYEGVWSRSYADDYYRRVFWMSLACSGAIGRRFCQKSPPDVFLIPFLAQVFPDAKFIHLLRDGRDVAASLLQRGWLNRTAAGGQSDSRRDRYRHVFYTGDASGPYPRYWVEPERRASFIETTDLHRCIWCWRRHVESAIRAGRQLPASRYLEVRYEQAVSNPRATAAMIMAFLEVQDPITVNMFADAMSRVRADGVGKHRRSAHAPLDSPGYQEGRDLLSQLGYVDEAHPA